MIVVRELGGLIDVQVLCFCNIVDSRTAFSMNEKEMMLVTVQWGFAAVG